ncbi:cell division protein Cdc14 [Dipodascopsis tothii]|uniref:cell division protein Cdc14 n=1 Tax=Dipodascopsis tothii TaxID=44089 RepID=UPI0034CD2E03
MEALLSTSFDSLSSYDPSSVRRGLRQIEGLLAHLCRPYTSGSRAGDTRIADDPAYREFLRLQDGFEWNIALRLTACLERLLGQESNDLTTLLILSTLNLLQGALLIHAASRRVFAREVNMTILLDLLEPQSSPAIQGATINCLVCALVEEWDNVRTFEALDGLASVCSLFKRKDTEKDVKLKILEFLFFYLVPEPPRPPEGSVRSLSSVRARRRTTEEKQKMLGKYLSNVESIVHELQQNHPFGDLGLQTQ